MIGQQVLLDRELAKDALLLGQIAHSAIAGAAIHRPGGDIDSVENNLACIGLDDAAGHAEAGGLAGAVGTQQADDFAPLHVEIDAIHDAAAAEALYQTANFQKRHDWSSVTVAIDHQVKLANAAHPRKVWPERNVDLVAEHRHLKTPTRRPGVRPINVNCLPDQQPALDILLTHPPQAAVLTLRTVVAEHEELIELILILVFQLEYLVSCPRVENLGLDRCSTHRAEG